MVMDSKALLDYALFQLTPTRTRCDLVIFCGKKNEKIASGLLEPFLSHLKYAKDVISKGGYSITLKPSHSHNSLWFTKATLERFVRFVSTPEILERFVTIEKEIDQIERSSEQAKGVAFHAQGNASTGDGEKKFLVGQSKSECESNGEAEENPKIRLQRVLESRKAVLKKEQAMAYARALVAGFELGDINDLVSFSDAFGALRLREACVNFIELCNKKNGDKIWMDEVAAMQASYMGTPGMILTRESNELLQSRLDKSSTSDSITRHGSLDTSEGTENALPMEFNSQQTEGAAAQMASWPHYQHPHYMHSAQGPVFQQMPLYPGYIFPGSMPSHYPWAANFQDLGDGGMEDGRRYKSSNKKPEKPVPPSNGESIYSDASSSSYSPSDSSSEREHKPSLSHTHTKKHGRRSSKKVVIRNINYITSARNEDRSSASDSDSSGEDQGSLKQLVGAAIGRHRQQTSNKNRGRDGAKKGSSESKIDLDEQTNYMEERKDGNWDIFQNLLMRDSDSMPMDMGSENIPLQEEYSGQKGIGEESRSSRKLGRPNYGNDDLIVTEKSPGNVIERTESLLDGETNFHGAVRKSSKDETLLVPQRVEGEYHLRNAHFGTESSIMKSQKEVDWIIGSKVETSGSSDVHMDRNIFRGDQSSTNSFQIGVNKSDVLLDDSFMVQSRVSDGPSLDQPKADMFVVSEIVGANECMPGNIQGNAEGSNYKEPEDLYMMLGRDSDAPKQIVPTWSPEMDYGEDISLVETAGILDSRKLKDKAGAAPVLGSVNKSNIKNSKKLGTEVDRRAPKSKAPSGNLGRSKSDIPLRSKMLPTGSTPARGRAEKEEDKRKKMEQLLLQRQKRIAERSAAKVTTLETTNRSLNESKNSVSTKAQQTKLRSPAEENKSSRKPVMKSSTIDRLAAPRTASKQLPTESKVGPSRKPTSKGSSLTATPSIKKPKGTIEKRDKVDPSPKNVSTTSISKDSSNIQEKVCTGNTCSVLEESGIAEGALDKNGTDDSGAKVLHAVTLVEKREISVISKEDASDDKKSVEEELLLPEVPAEKAVVHINNATNCVAVEKNLKPTDMNITEKKRISFSPQISVMDISTTPPPDSKEQNHSRKKWNNGEGSPKIPRGFRRLLLFGRRT